MQQKMKLYEMAQKLSMLVSLQEFLYDQSASTTGSDKRTKSVIALISDCSNDVKNRGGKAERSLRWCLRDQP